MRKWTLNKIYRYLYGDQGRARALFVAQFNVSSLRRVVYKSYLSCYRVCRLSELMAS